MENSKRTVKKIPHTDNYTLIRAIVIGIAYREKIKERHKMLIRPTNKQLQAEVYRAVVACNIINRKCEISDMAELEKYFKKYKLVLLDENYIDSEKVIYVNNKQKFEKIIYIQCSTGGFNVIDSMESYCGKYYFCEHCTDIFSYVRDHEFCEFKEYDKFK